MGVNIEIFSRGKSETPEWDWIRQGSDREFSMLVSNRILPSETYVDEECPQEPIWYYRPSNFEAWKVIIESSTLEPKERYFQLVDVLLNNPEIWIRFNY